MDEESQKAQEPVNESRGDHETGVKRPTDDAAERVPALGVEPVPELVKAFLGQELGDPVIEVWIKLMDHGFVTENAEETSDESQDVDEAKDGDADQELLLLGLELEASDGEVAEEIGGNRRWHGCLRAARLGFGSGHGIN